MKILATLAVLAGMMTAAQAQAADGGFYIEPGITYEKGDNTMDWSAPFSNSTGDTKGLGLDIKLGFHASDVFFVGLEGAYSKPKFTHSATSYDAEATSTLYGAVIGAQMPIVGLRIWGGYVFGGELNPDQSGSVDLNFKDARGPKVGVGFRVLMVSLNVEYMDLEYQNTVIEQAGPITGTLDNKLKNKVGLISVSLPITL